MKIRATIVALFAILLFLTDCIAGTKKEDSVNEVAKFESIEMATEENMSKKPDEAIYVSQTNNYVFVNVEEKPVAEITLTDDEINLISLITVGEAEGEEDIGKRLVIDTILNRVDSLYFPNSVSDVIYQESQFSCVWNGRLDRCVITDEIRELVISEATKRTNREVIFFTAGEYGKYGVPMFKEGNHYFCSYE